MAIKVIIVGASETGKVLAHLLSTDEYSVTLVEEDEAVAKKVANEIDALVIHGDGTDIGILKDAGIEEAYAIVTCTKDDKTNLMISEIAKSTSVKKIVSVVNLPKNEELFIKLGITQIISAVGTTATRLRQLLSQPAGERIIAQLGAGEVEIIELHVEKGSKLAGALTSEYSQGIIATIYRSGDLIIPDKKTKIAEGDVLLLAVKTKDVRNVKKQTKGT